MKKFKKGLIQAVEGIILSVVVTVLINSLAQDGLIPAYASWGLLAFGVIGNIMTLNSMKVASVTYTVGWLIGCWFLKDMLGPVDFAVNVVVPVLILGLKSLYWVKRKSRKLVKYV